MFIFLSMGIVLLFFIGFIKALYDYVQHEDV